MAGSLQVYSRAMRALAAIPLTLLLGCASAARPTDLPAPSPELATPQQPSRAPVTEAPAGPASGHPLHAATDRVFERFDRPDAPGCALAVT